MKVLHTRTNWTEGRWKIHQRWTLTHLPIREVSTKLENSVNYVSSIKKLLRQCEILDM